MERDRYQRIKRPLLEADELPGPERAAKLGRHQRKTAAYLIWAGTGDPDCLRHAREHLAFLVEHAPPEVRRSLQEDVFVNRKIRAAWDEQGG